jgi:hypothetical protein
MVRIEDLPAAKAERFGKQFLEIITDFCQQHQLPMDQFPTVDLYSKVTVSLFNKIFCVMCF